VTAADAANVNGPMRELAASLPDLDPAPVLDAVARDPRLRVFLGDGRIEALPARQS
jgi:hypothetical protein